MVMPDEEHKARFVQGAACVGAPIESPWRASDGRRRVVLRAMSFVDPRSAEPDYGPRPWNEVRSAGHLEAVREVLTG